MMLERQNNMIPLANLECLARYMAHSRHPINDGGYGCKDSNSGVGLHLSKSNSHGPGGKTGWKTRTQGKEGQRLSSVVQPPVSVDSLESEEQARFQRGEEERWKEGAAPAPLGGKQG